MNGPQHYKQAEHLIQATEHFVDLARKTADAGNDAASEAAKWAVDHLVAKAQVHATLALAAASYDATVINGQQANAANWQAATR